MKRKVNRVGVNTLTVSLPSKWAKENHVNVGDEVGVEVKEREIVITPDGKRNLNSVSLDINNFNNVIINKFLMELYRQGVDRITLRFKNNKFHDYKSKTDKFIDKYILDQINKRFIGLEVISKTSNQIVLQNLMPYEEHEKIDVIKNRIYFLTKEFLEEFLESMGKDFSQFHAKSYELHDNIARFYSYYIRLLNTSNLPEEQRVHLYGSFTLFDSVIDKIRHTSERVNELNKINPRLKLILSKIFKFHLDQFQIVLKERMTINELDEIIKKRYQLVQTLNQEKFSESERKVINEASIILDLIKELTETYAAIHLKEYLV